MLTARAAWTTLEAIAIAAVASSCVASRGEEDPRPVQTTRAAITGGTPTIADLGVVALMKGGALVCTATLISPRVLLTAAHCVPVGEPPDAVFGSAPSTGTRLRIIAVKRHPRFVESTLSNDIALALLERAPPSGASPWPLPPAPLDTTSVGLALRLVGFGLSAPNDTTPPQKRTGTTAIASLTTSELAFVPSPSQTCAGDSGGPAFAMMGGVEVIVGVTSSGDPECAQSARDMRVDAYASFITPWLRATEEGAALAGERCYYASNCAASAGACTPALDDATLSFCAPPCGSGDACGASMQCIEGPDGRKICRHPAPSPGALAAICGDDADCSRGRCVAPATGGASVCALSCFRDLPGFCDAPYRCEAIADAGASESACFAPRSVTTANGVTGGCALGPRRISSEPRHAALLAIALLAFGARRRFSRRTRDGQDFAAVAACACGTAFGSGTSLASALARSPARCSLAMST